MKAKDINKIKELLLPLYNRNGAERCGFVKNNAIVEVKNTSKNMESFRVCSDDIIKHGEDPDTWGTWHTHPNQDSNLSGEDHDMMRSYAHYVHFIVGNDGVRAFQYDPSRGAVMEVE